MSKCSCCDNPRLAQCLVRLGVGALFFVPGVMKFLDPMMFQGMLETLFGWTGLLILVGYWVVVAFEILGGFFVVLGPLVPRWLYKISLLGLLVISLVALVAVRIPAGDWVVTLFQILATLSIIGLLITKPLCPMKGCEK